MNSKITIGTVSIEWKLAKGTYSANLLTALELNAFDKIIGGLIYASGNDLNQNDLGRIMGFNVDSVPEQHKYRDEAECKVLDNAIVDMASYGLLTRDVTGKMSLTQAGVHSLSERKKHTSKQVSFDLYFDLLSGKDSLAKGLFEDDSAKALEEEIEIEDDRAEKAIVNQHPNLVNSEKGKSLEGIKCTSIKGETISLPFDIIYDLSTNTYEVFCTKGDSSEIIEEMVNNNDDIRESIVQQFFLSAKESVIFKPIYQETIEKTIGVSSEGGADFPLIVAKDDFVHSILALDKTDMPLQCFFLDSINDKRVEWLSAYAKKNNTTMICVEYVGGEDKYSDYSPVYNILFQKVDKLSASCLCSYSDGSFYEDRPFVFNYQGVDYQIPLVTWNEEHLYKSFVLAKPFAQKECSTIIRDFDPVILANKDFNRVINFVAKYNNIHTLIEEFTKVLPDFQVDKDDLYGKFQWYLNKVTESFETDVTINNIKGEKAGQVAENLKTFKIICEEYAKDLVERIESLLRRMGQAKPKVLQRHAYLIDTNVFIDNPDCLNDYNRLEDMAFIPWSISEELDNMAHPWGKNFDKAVQAKRNIERTEKDSPQFIKRISVTMQEKKARLPEGFDLAKNDNDLLALALRLMQRDNFNGVTIITSDGDLNRKAQELNIDVRAER